MAGNIIELADLTKKYGSFTAVDRLNLSIRKSEIFGLLGPNGAGKSTTILMMLGLTEPTSGSVSVCGINPASNPIEVKRKIGYLPEDVGFYYNLTARENLLFTARLNSLPDREAVKSVEQLLARVGLSDAAGKKTGKYSRGMLQRLGLADVLIKNPEVIILDEPTLGIDPTGVREFLDLIVELSREEGITVLFSSHDLHHVQQVCDRVGLFVSGKLLAEGDIQTLSGKLFSKSPFIIEARLALNAADHPDGAQLHPVEWMQKILQKTGGINEVQFKDEIFEIGCSRDASADIARAIVASGAGLIHLNKKEYGLKDIYYRYFEGGADNE
ncbi:MAG TPA: ABC transporter ATP-binding protein [Prolixibacteraceae bacterium]|nr:ABC transporter ATP-binding protein [Prolixibacteraceae bacterium]